MSEGVRAEPERCEACLRPLPHTVPERRVCGDPWADPKPWDLPGWEEPPITYPTSLCRADIHATEGACFECCETCNLDNHWCPGCGEPLTHEGREYRSGEVHGVSCVD